MLLVTLHNSQQAQLLYLIHDHLYHLLFFLSGKGPLRAGLNEVSSSRPVDRKTKGPLSSNWPVRTTCAARRPSQHTRLAGRIARR